MPEPAQHADQQEHPDHSDILASMVASALMLYGLSIALAYQAGS